MMKTWLRHIYIIVVRLCEFVISPVTFPIRIQSSTTSCVLSVIREALPKPDGTCVSGRQVM